MEQLPDLSKLSHPGKDMLIESLWMLLHKQLKAQTQQIASLTAKVKELEDRLAKNSKTAASHHQVMGLLNLIHNHAVIKIIKRTGVVSLNVSVQSPCISDKRLVTNTSGSFSHQLPLCEAYTTKNIFS